ncbi:MAG: hypothetical protein J7555_11870, partial [Chloroflexi bacterium]|nr:hypothetical protein [Chloroflexota bacterium]
QTADGRPQVETADRRQQMAKWIVEDRRRRATDRHGGTGLEGGGWWRRETIRIRAGLGPPMI